MLEGGWRAVLADATLHRVCGVRAVTSTAHPDPPWTSMGADIIGVKYVNVSETWVKSELEVLAGGDQCRGRRRLEGCAGCCHTPQGLWGQSHDKRNPFRPSKKPPWGLTFQVSETWVKSDLEGQNQKYWLENQKYWLEATNVVVEGGWRAVLAGATLHRVCWVRAITSTAHPDPLRTSMDPDILSFRNLDEIRRTGWGRAMSCLRNFAGLCWLMSHSAGSVGSEQ